VTAELISSEVNNRTIFQQGFMHYFLLIKKYARLEERQFYMLAAARQFWSVTILEHQIESGLYEKQGNYRTILKAPYPKHYNQ